MWRCTPELQNSSARLWLVALFGIGFCDHTAQGSSHQPILGFHLIEGLAMCANCNDSDRCDCTGGASLAVYACVPGDYCPTCGHDAGGGWSQLAQAPRRRTAVIVECE